MKVAALLACTCVVLSSRRAACAAVKAPLDIISLDDLTQSDREHLDYLNSQYPRPKRSGDYDAFGSIKESIGQSIKSKIGLIAKGSASASAHFSSGSSGGHSYHNYDVPQTYDHKSFDFWSLKKSILNTLLQAVKAIKGGVIAIKGQLIKGSGYLISAKGKLISTKGEAITSLGKNIASSAVLSPYPHHHGHSDYGHPHSYHHSGPSEEYGSPSAPGPEYEVPDHYHAPPHEGMLNQQMTGPVPYKPDAEHAGILILKKIPPHDGHSGHLPLEHKVPNFKPIDHSGPGLGAIVGKFFSASTSLKPGEPAPFGHSSPGYDQIYDHPHQSHHAAADYPNHEDYHEGHSSSNNNHETQPESTHNEYLPPQSHHHENNDNSKPPSTNYGSPFEAAPSFLNLEYASESKKAAKVVSNSDKEPEKPQFQATTPRTYDEIRTLPGTFSSSDFDSTGFLANAYEKPNLFLATTAEKPNQSFPPYSPQAQALPSINPSSYGFDSGAFPSLGSANDLKYLSPPSLAPQNFPSSSGLGTYSNSHNAQSVKPSRPNYYRYHDSTPSESHKTPVKRPPRGKMPPKHKKPPTYDIVRSVAFELGPNGPKRL